MAGSKKGYEELLTQLRIREVLTVSIGKIKEMGDKTIPAMRSELRSQMQHDSFATLLLPTLREESEEFDDIADFKATLDSEYQVSLTTTVHNIQKLAEQHHFSTEEMQDMVAQLNGVKPASGVMSTDVSEKDVENLYAIEEVIIRTSSVLEGSTTLSSKTLRSDLQAVLNIGCVSKQIAETSDIRTIMENEADDDEIEDIKPVMSSEINALLKSIKARQQEAIDKLKLNCYEIALLKSRASRWLIKAEIESLKAKATDDATPSQAEDMQALQDRLSKAERLCVLKKGDSM